MFICIHKFTLSECSIKKSVFSERRYINTVASIIHFLKVQHLQEFEIVSVKSKKKKNVKDVNLAANYLKGLLVPKLPCHCASSHREN